MGKYTKKLKLWGNLHDGICIAFKKNNLQKSLLAIGVTRVSLANTTAESAALPPHLSEGIYFIFCLHSGSFCILAPGASNWHHVR